MNLPKIEKLLAEGWILTVTAYPSGGLHLSVHSGKRNGPDSYHCVGHDPLARALERLETYVIDLPEIGTT